MGIRKLGSDLVLGVGYLLLAKCLLLSFVNGMESNCGWLDAQLNIQGSEGKQEIKDLSDLLEEYSKQIEPSEQERKVATEGFEFLKSVLLATKQFSEVILAGSYSRGTYVSPLHDIDIVAVVSKDNSVCTSVSSRCYNEMEQLLIKECKKKKQID